MTHASYFLMNPILAENGNQPDANEALINGSHYIFSFIHLETSNSHTIAWNQRGFTNAP